MDLISALINKNKQLIPMIAAWQEYITAANLDPEKPVAILAKRNISLIPLLLACLGRGQLFSIIDKNLPAGELKQYLSVTAVIIDLESQPLPSQKPVEIKPVDYDRAYYMAFTSGTTGRPKVVTSSLYSLAVFLQWYTRSLDLSANDHFAMLSGLGYDPLIRDIFTPLILGAKIAVPLESDYKNGQIISWLAAENITVVHLTPTLGRIWLSHQHETISLPQLRYLVFGGEPLYYQDLQKWRQIAPDCTFINSYGLTESPQIFLSYKINPSDHLMDNGQVPVGIARPDVRVSIEQDGSAVPAFYRGEVVLRSHALALEVADQTLYTGDYGYSDDAGNIHLEGRRDQQLKRSGVRVEPAAINDIINSLPEVSQCALLAEDSRLLAWLCPAPCFTASQVRQALQNNLRPAFIPDQIIFVEEIPYNGHGKIDFDKLPRSVIEREIPKSIWEDELVEIITKIITVETLDRDLSFYQLGLDSLGLVILHSKLVALHNELAGLLFIDLLTHNSIAKLGEFLTTLASAEQIIKAGHHQIARASYEQESIWALCQLYGNNANILAARLEIQGLLNKERLTEVWNIILERHPILRATFKLEGSKLQQQLMPIKPAQLVEINGDNFDGYWEKFIQSEFDLIKGPPWRIALINSNNRQQLFFAVHHIVMDGSSIALLLTEMEQLFQGRVLSQLSCDYLDYAEWEHHNQSDAVNYEVRPPCLCQENIQESNNRNQYSRIIIAEPIVSSLKQMAKQYNAPISHILLAIWFKVLAQSAGASEITIGLNDQARNYPQLQNIIGLFTKVLPITVDSKVNFRELLKQIGINREHCLANNISIKNSYGMVGFNMSPNNSKSWSFGAAKLFEIPNNNSRSPFKLELRVALAKELQLEIQYWKNSYQEETINYLLQRYEEILQQLIAQPGSEMEIDNIRALRLPDPAPTLPPLLQSIYDEVVKNSGAAAVVSDQGQVTYGELWDTSSLWCAKLWSMGLRQGGICATFRPADTDQIAIVLAIWRLGAAYLPLDYYHHESRLKELDKLGNQVVLVTADISPNIQGDFAEHWPELSDRAYLIYTSGSTGTPKAAQLTQRGLALQIGAKLDLIGFHPGETMALVTSLAFDQSIWQLVGPLSRGGTVAVLTSTSPLFNPTELNRELENYRVDILELVPSQLDIWLNHSHEFHNVRALILAGEPFSKALAEKTLALNPPFTIWNFYGPTECSDDVAGGEITLELVSSWPEKILPIGRQLAGATLQIVNSEHQRLPPLCPGELLISGPYVGLGYLNNPELTAKVFKDFGYLTGDLAYETLDGQFVVLGRKDQQVKLRGYRIEIEEIEAALKRYPQVSEAAVTVIGSGDEVELKGLLIAPPSLDGAELYGYLKSQLPDYMIPASFLLVDELPYLPSGKLDRKNLGQLSGTPIQLRVNREPQGPVEEQIATLFREILGLTEVDANTSFFGYGGSSLLLLELRNRIITIFGKEIGVADLFNRNSVAELAELLGQSKLRVNKIVHRNLSVAPASPSQKRFWLLWHIEREPRLYNTQLSYYLPLKVGEGRIRAALVKLMERHVLLHTELRMQEGELYQYVNKNYGIPLIFKDYSTVPGGENQAEQELAEFFNNILDIENGENWILWVGVLGANRTLLALNIHHLVEDHESVAIFFKELWDLYNGLDVAPAPVIDFLDYTIWLQEQRTAEVKAQEVLNYQQQLIGSVSGYLPGELETTNLAGDCIVDEWSSNSWNHIRRQLQNEAVTIFELTMWAYIGALAKISNGQRVRVAYPAQHRTNPELSGMIAPLLETLVCAPDPEVLKEESGLNEMANLLRRMMVFSHVPFEELPSQEVKYFFVEHDPFAGPDIANIELGHHNMAHLMAKYPITLYLEEADDSFTLRLVYRQKQYSRKLMASLMAEIRKRIESWIGQKSSTPISENHLQPLEPIEQKVWPFERLWLKAERIGAMVAAWQQQIISASFNPDRPIALLTSRREELISLILACLGCGQLFAIVDKSLPPGELSHYLAALNGVIDVDSPPQPSNVELIIRPINYERPYYQAFTSGTTGRPKVVTSSLYSLGAFLQWYIDSFDLSDTDHFAMLSGLGFDPLLRDIFTPLALGAELSIPSPNQYQSGNIIPWLAAKGVTVVHLTPTLGRIWLSRYKGSEQLPKLRYLVFGGEPLYYQDLKAWRDVAPNCTFINSYGLTESPQIFLSYRITPEMSLPGSGQVPIGVARPDVLATIEQDGKVMPAFYRGELVLRSQALALEVADKILHTGDYGYFDDEGNIHLEGRLDQQLKRSGVRVELTAIQNALAEVAGIAAFYLTSQEERLIALIQPEPGVSEVQIKKNLLAKMRLSFIPDLLVFMAELPVNSHGKVDWRQVNLLQSNEELPVVAAEEQLIKQLQELIPDVVIERNRPFFALGLDSLLLVALTERLHKIDPSWQNISVIDLFQYPSVARLGNYLDSLQNQTGTTMVDHPAAASHRSRLARRRH